MSRTCRNMEDSGKHRFHGLEHVDAALHNLLPHLYPARLRSLRENARAENLKRRTEDGKRGTEHSKCLCALIATRRHIRFNSPRTLLLMLVGASTPRLVSSGQRRPVPPLARTHVALPLRQQNRRTRNQLSQGPPPPVRPATRSGSVTQLQLRAQFARRTFRIFTAGV